MFPSLVCQCRRYFTHDGDSRQQKMNKDKLIVKYEIFLERGTRFKEVQPECFHPSCVSVAGISPMIETAHSRK